MHKKIISVLIATILISVWCVKAGLGGEEQTKLMHKFDQVLANQEKMLKQFEEIKQELAIIKVRASR